MMSSPAQHAVPRRRASAPPSTDTVTPPGVNTGLPAGHRGVLGRQPHLGGRRHLLRALPRRSQGSAPRGSGTRTARICLGSRDSRLWSAISARCSCSTTIWPGRPPTTSKRGYANWPRTAWTRNWPSPTRCWPCSTTRTSNIRERIFRVYNEHIAERAGTLRRSLLRSGSDQLVGSPRRAPHADRAEIVGPQDVSDADQPGQRRRRPAHRLLQHAMSAVWDEIEESGLPLTHHIGESQPKFPSEVNSVAVAMMVNIDSFREMFSKYIFGGILDRHPPAADRLVRGRNRLGPHGAAGCRARPGLLPAHADALSPNTTSATTGTPTCARRSWSTAWA